MAVSTCVRIFVAQWQRFILAKVGFTLPFFANGMRAIRTKDLDIIPLCSDALQLCYPNTCSQNTCFDLINANEGHTQSQPKSDKCEQPSKETKTQVNWNEFATFSSFTFATSFVIRYRWLSGNYFSPHCFEIASDEIIISFFILANLRRAVARNKTIFTIVSWTSEMFVKLVFFLLSLEFNLPGGPMF